MSSMSPIIKPYGVAPSPSVVGGLARGLWNNLAFVAPFNTTSVGKSLLLDAYGRPLGLLPTVNGVQWRATPYGLGFGRVSGTADTRLLRFAGQVLTTANDAGTDDFTLAVLCNPRAEATARNMVSQRLNGTNPRVFLQANIGAAGSTVSRGFGFVSVDAAGNTEAVATGVTDGAWHLFLGRRLGTEMRLFRDGISVSSATGTPRDISVASTELVIGGIGSASTGVGINDADSIAGCWAWNRALTNAEIRLLARDPFCMFRPMLNSKIYNTVAASSFQAAWARNANVMIGAGTP